MVFNKYKKLCIMPVPRKQLHIPLQVFAEVVKVKWMNDDHDKDVGKMRWENNNNKSGEKVEDDDDGFLTTTSPGFVRDVHMYVWMLSLILWQAILFLLMMTQCIFWKKKHKNGAIYCKVCV